MIHTKRKIEYYQYQIGSILFNDKDRKHTRVHQTLCRLTFHKWRIYKELNSVHFFYYICFFVLHKKKDGILPYQYQTGSFFQ
jgi:hypothetical protein